MRACPCPAPILQWPIRQSLHAAARRPYSYAGGHGPSSVNSGPGSLDLNLDVDFILFRVENMKVHALLFVKIHPLDKSK